MTNYKSKLIIIGIIILLGLYICKKKVENNYLFFTILGYILLVVLFLLFYFYTNFIEKGRAEECLITSKPLIVQSKILPVEKAKPMLLSKPFDEFIISTSHNTYLPCTQNGDIVSTDAITNALKLGARVIELDVFAKNNLGNTPDDSIPVVTHGIELSTGDIFTTGFIYFKDCIQAIKNFASTTLDPIWIDIELNTNNEQTQSIMRQILLENFSTKILDKKFKISNRNKHFSSEPIGNLLNKIILTTSKSPNSITKYLTDIFDSYAGDGYYTNNSSDDLNKISRGKINRVFPSGNIYGNFSYNFDPEPFWKKRIQLVALNFQKTDNNFIKNIKMFNTCSFIHFSELD